jgi:Flp pilus assembly protein TadD
MAAQATAANNLALRPSVQTTLNAATSVNNNNTTAALRTTTPPSTPPPTTTTSPATTSTSPDSNTAQRQQQATRDTLAQAQTLWNNGEQDAAINLLTQAQETLERNVAKSPTAPLQTLLAATVRELTRLQIQQGRLASANANLVRLEPLLPKDADIWALRANLSQRLGRHADSLHAYLSALELRPDEPRWLLGAAVSLAATGQTSRAGELAAQAQQSGPIQRDIQQYLVQMGVPLKER